MNIIADKAIAQPQQKRQFIRRIGSSCYEVTIHFSNTSKENLNDKVKRLIRNEVINSKAVENNEQS